MKKSVFVLLLIVSLVSSVSSILAVEMVLSKNSYQPQELLQAEITGNFFSLTSDNIFIFKGDKLHSEPIIKDLTKQNNVYYFYAIVPNQEGNFTLQIDGVRYLDRGKIKDEPIISDFVIEYKNTSDLSINPGFIIPGKDFSVKVKSLYKNVDVSAIFEATDESKDVFLIEGIGETLKFSLPELAPGMSRITVNNYEIPVFLIRKLEVPSEILLEFIPYQLIGTITEDKDYRFTIVVKNVGNENLTDVSFSSDLDAKIIPETISLIEPDSVEIINLTISVSKIEGESLSGKVSARIDGELFDLPVLFNITTNVTEINITDVTDIKPISGTKELSCSEIGKICQGSSVCTGDTIGSLEGPCCIGQCVEDDSGDYSTIVGIILIIVLILIIIYVVWKVKKRKKIKSPKEILKQRTNKYNQRMKGGEVSGELDKV